MKTESKLLQDSVGFSEPPLARSVFAPTSFFPFFNTFFLAIPVGTSGSDSYPSLQEGLRGKAGLQKAARLDETNVQQAQREIGPSQDASKLRRLLVILERLTGRLGGSQLLALFQSLFLCHNNLLLPSPEEFRTATGPQSILP